MSEHNEFNSNGKIIQMRCPGCGAVLEISKDNQDLACGYCGSSLHVIRSGGTVTLSLVGIVDQVRANTDRTASELALVRLADELQEIKSDISKYTETMRVAVRPVPTFGYFIPGRDREIELGIQLGITLCAIVFGALFHWLWFIAFFTLALFVALPGRAVRIKEDKEYNASVLSNRAFCQSILNDLHRKEKVIEEQVTMHRRLLNSVVVRQ